MKTQHQPVALEAAKSQHFCCLKPLPALCFRTCAQLHCRVEVLLQMYRHAPTDRNSAPLAGTTHWIFRYARDRRAAFPFVYLHMHQLSPFESSNFPVGVKKRKARALSSSPVLPPPHPPPLREHSMQAAIKSRSCTSSSAVAVLCGSCRGSDIHLGTSPRDSG